MCLSLGRNSGCPDSYPPKFGKKNIFYIKQLNIYQMVNTRATSVRLEKRRGRSSIFSNVALAKLKKIKNRNKQKHISSIDAKIKVVSEK